MSREPTKDLFSPLFSVQNIVLFLAILFVLALFKLTSSELASWVQAIGSIAAIWGAFKVGNTQTERQIEQNNEDSRQKSMAYFAVVQCAADHALALGEFVDKRPPACVFKESWRLVFSDVFESSLNSLKILPSHELGNYDLVIFHNGLLGAMANMSRKITMALNASAFQEMEVSQMYNDVLTQYILAKFNWEKFKQVSTDHH